MAALREGTAAEKAGVGEGHRGGWGAISHLLKDNASIVPTQLALAGSNSLYVNQVTLPVPLPLPAFEHATELKCIMHNLQKKVQTK
jgi:hypothetical protein